MAHSNVLVVIGLIGSKRAYLNISVTKAKERYRRDVGELPSFGDVCVFAFNDEFCVYDAWELFDESELPENEMKILCNGAKDFQLAFRDVWNMPYVVVFR